MPETPEAPEGYVAALLDERSYYTDPARIAQVDAELAKFGVAVETPEKPNPRVETAAKKAVAKKAAR